MQTFRFFLNSLILCKLLFNSCIYYCLHQISFYIMEIYLSVVLLITEVMDTFSPLCSNNSQLATIVLNDALKSTLQ